MYSVGIGKTWASDGHKDLYLPLLAKNDAILYYMVLLLVANHCNLFRWFIIWQKKTKIVMCMCVYIQSIIYIRDTCINTAFNTVLESKLVNPLMNIMLYKVDRRFSCHRKTAFICRHSAGYSQDLWTYDSTLVVVTSHHVTFEILILGEQ